jgi:hypothetical protein
LQIPEAFLPKEIVIDLSGSPLRSLPFATLPLGEDPELGPSGGPVSAHARDQRGASMNGATFYLRYHSVVATIIYIPPALPAHRSVGCNAARPVAHRRTRPTIPCRCTCGAAAAHASPRHPGGGAGRSCIPFGGWVPDYTQVSMGEYPLVPLGSSRALGTRISTGELADLLVTRRYAMLLHSQVRSSRQLPSCPASSQPSDALLALCPSRLRPRPSMAAHGPALAEGHLLLASRASALCPPARQHEA